MYKLLIILNLLFVCNLFGQGNHRFKFTVEKGLLFEENTTTVEYINAAPVSRDATFKLDKSFALNLQYLLRMFDFGPSETYREDFDMAWLVDLTYGMGNDVNFGSIQGGASVEFSWFQFQTMIGMTGFSKEISNPGYNPANEQYSWYDTSPTTDLSGFTFTLAMLLDIPVSEIDLGQVGIIGGIRYMQILGEDYTERFGVNIGMSLVL